MDKKNILISLLLCCIFSNSFFTKAQINPTENIIGIDISLPQSPSYTYDSAFFSSYSLGMRQIGLHFLWKTSLEATPGIFDLTYIDFANVYYPYYQIPVDLNIDPIETNRLEFPDDIDTLELDHPIVIQRFKNLLDSIFVHIPNLELSSLIIGSEVDGYLGSDSAKWAQYTNFYEIVGAYAKTIRPGLKIACEIMSGGITGASSQYVQTLNEFSDIIGISYYPMYGNFTVKPATVVESDFSNFVNLYPNKPIFFYQIGYPSSTKCNSSEEKQSEFIRQVFQSWDNYSSNIAMVDFTWLHDWSPDALTYWSNYYGISDTSFIGFLGSIGLRNWENNGSDKLAYMELQCQAKSRGFNTLPINCGVSISEDLSNQKYISTFPNPAQNQLFLTTSSEVMITELTIYNSYGVIMKRFFDINPQNFILNTSDLANGLYFLMVKNQDFKQVIKFSICK